MLFSEQNFRRGEYCGSIEVVCGSMFSGKTEELIRRLKRAQIAKLNVEIFKPRTDVRYDETAVVSHNYNSVQSTPVDHSSAILLLGANTQVVGIDEAQFFDDELPDVCNKLANKGIRVIVAGLDMDFSGKPFGPMPALMSIAAVEALPCILTAPAAASRKSCWERKTVMSPDAVPAFTWSLKYIS
jgi:thymidine kinase